LNLHNLGDFPLALLTFLFLFLADRKFFQKDNRFDPPADTDLSWLTGVFIAELTQAFYS
jgi:hypothetical protein